jgi:hypothetical protein
MKKEIGGRQRRHPSDENQDVIGLSQKKSYPFSVFHNTSGQWNGSSFCRKGHLAIEQAVCQTTKHGPENRTSPISLILSLFINSCEYSSKRGSRFNHKNWRRKPRHYCIIFIAQ